MSRAGNRREAKNDSTALAQVDFAGMVARRLAELHNLKLAVPAAGLITQGVLGVLQDPFAPRRGPRGPSTYRESAIENAHALVPGPVARL
jgi:hypothetical protein